MRYHEIILEAQLSGDSWWHPTHGFVAVEDNHHHNEMIEDDPARFGVDPALVQAEMAKPHYSYDHNEPMLMAALQQGWVRIAYGGEDVQVWRDRRLSRAAITAILAVRQPTHLFLDLEGPDGTKGYRLEPEQITQFVEDGRLPPSA